MMKFITATAAGVGLLAASTLAMPVTGNPLTDGWNSFGNSLDSGTYVRGEANYGFQTFGVGFAIQAGSNLEISDGNYSWNAGDTVLAVGGVVQTPSSPGWTISGTTPNSLFSNPTGPKLQVKFGTAAATWTTSTIAPGAGNGLGGGGNGGGSIQIRTPAYMTQNQPTTPGEVYDWASFSGKLLLPAKPGHISGPSGLVLDTHMARFIWNYDPNTGEVGSWEILLNVSLLATLNPNYTGLLPGLGDMAILTVQNGDNAYTDALVRGTPSATVPDATPMIGAALLLVPLAAAALRTRRQPHNV